MITAEDVAKTAVDVTIDACFSTVTYYYTDPIMDMGKQTLINSLVDGAVDIGESYLFGEQERISNDSVVNRTSCSGMSDFTIMRGRRNCVIYDV